MVTTVAGLGRESHTYIGGSTSVHELITLNSNSNRFNHPSDQIIHPDIHNKALIIVKIHRIIHTPEIYITHRTCSTSLLSRSLFFNNINVWSYGSGKNFLPISSLFVEIKYVNEKRPMLYNGIFGYHQNMCYVIFINAFFARYMV